jgi:hypothetical protein
MSPTENVGFTRSCGETWWDGLMSGGVNRVENGRPLRRERRG